MSEYGTILFFFLQKQTRPLLRFFGLIIHNITHVEYSHTIFEICSFRRNSGRDAARRQQQMRPTTFLMGDRHVRAAAVPIQLTKLISQRRRSRVFVLVPMCVCVYVCVGLCKYACIRNRLVQTGVIIIIMLFIRKNLYIVI